MCSGRVGYGTDAGYESCRQSAFATGSGERGAVCSAVSLHCVCDNNILSHIHHGGPTLRSREPTPGLWRRRLGGALLRLQRAPS